MIAAILNLGLNIVFIPMFGILAAAITTLASYLFSFLAMWYFSSKEFHPLMNTPLHSHEPG